MSGGPRETQFRDGVARESTVVFYDHGFSAGHLTAVQVMPAPHRHTQFEINHVLEGEMVYRFEGRRIAVPAGGTALFAGMVPHQVTACRPGTQFICLYVPGGLLMELRIGEALRRALFGGSFVEALRPLDTDPSCFRRWHADLLQGHAGLGGIARDELGARLRRLDHDGWVDRSPPGTAASAAASPARGRPDKVQAMTHFIAEHWAEPLHVADVARAAGLHPNYAMALFRSTVGLTIADYLDRNRLDAARTLLAASDQDIAAVAFASGFGSLSGFYDRFRARFGTTPAAYRRGLRRGGPDEAPPPLRA